MHGSGARPECSVHGNGDPVEAPVMQHLSLSAVDLDRLYSPIREPADDQLEDLEDDDQDTILQSGLRIAGEIRTAMLTTGRTRRRDPVGSVSTSLLSVGGHRQEKRGTTTAVGSSTTTSLTAHDYGTRIAASQQSPTLTAQRACGHP